jgi:hypothetical protein
MKKAADELIVPAESVETLRASPARSGVGGLGGSAKITHQQPALSQDEVANERRDVRLNHST